MTQNTLEKIVLSVCSRGKDYSMLLLMYVLYILSATIADFIIILAATWLLVHCIMSELIRNVITAIFLHSRNRPDLIPKQVKNKQISNTLGAALFFLNKMVARKTIVSLVWYLLIGWAVWIIVNFNFIFSPKVCR